jgi:hypothetical protein
MGMDKGQWVKGKESALWVNAVPGLRPGTFSQVCFYGWFRLILIHGVAGIVERAGDRVCNAPVRRVSAILYRLIA